MKYVDYKGKQYELLSIKVYHKEYYPEGSWLTIGKEALATALDTDNMAINSEEEKIDENIYYYMPDSFDFSKVKEGDIIRLDERMKVLEIG